MNSEGSQNVLIAAGLQILDKIDPTIFPSYISSIGDDDESTLSQLYTKFDGEGMFKSLLIDTSLRSLVMIQISGAQKSDRNTSQTVVATDYNETLRSHKTYFASVTSLKFIFCRPNILPPKVFNCPIHGHIKLSCLSVKVMDTPQFQRLRDISQLGSICYVFGGAASKRFEHSLGVAHLARTFVRKLQTQQPELRISEVDALCVELAGLCHDLGHGPFSHLFDGTILPMMGAPPSFCHEHASIGIFDLLIHENELVPFFASCGLGLDDIHFVKELILGGAHEAPEGFNWKGRGDKTFLYDIVANKRNGVDVDRFDYFRRDCHLLGLKVCFDDARLMEFARVHYVNRIQDNVTNCAGNNESKDAESTKKKDLGTPTKINSLLEFQSVVTATSTSTTLTSTSTTESELKNENEIQMIKTSDKKDDHGCLEISFHIKEAWNIFELFHTRYALHKRAYHHPVSDAIDLMVAEAIVLADPYVFVPGLDRRPTRMSECVGDMHAYSRLGEYLFKMIEHSFEPGLQASRDIICRLRKRDLFVCASETLLSPQDCKILGTNSSRIKEEILKFKKKNFENDNRRNQKIDENLSLDNFDNKSNKLKLFHIIDSKHDINNAGLLLYDQISKLEDKDIFCRVFKMGFGKGKENPVTASTSFFKPDKNTDFNSDSDTNVPGSTSSVTYTEGIVNPMNCSRLIPTEFEETYLRMFCRHKHQSTAVSRLYTRWCEAQNVRIEEILTPHKKRKVDDMEA